MNAQSSGETNYGNLGFKIYESAMSYQANKFGINCKFDNCHLQ